MKFFLLCFASLLAYNSTVILAQSDEQLRDSILFNSSKENALLVKNTDFKEIKIQEEKTSKYINIAYERVQKDQVKDPSLRLFFLYKKAIHLRETTGDIEQVYPMVQAVYESFQADKSLIEKNPFLYGEVLTRFGYFQYYYNYDYQTAEQYYLQALDKYITKDSVYSYTTLLLNLTYLYRDKNNFSKAKEYALQARELRKAYGESNNYYLSSLNNLATVYEYFEEYDIAEDYYLLAKESAKDSNKTKQSQYIEILNNLGVLYINIGRYDEAENYIKQVIQYDLKKVMASTSADYAMSCHNLALVYYHKKEFVNAKHYLDICLNIEEVIYGKQSLNYARSLRSLADLYLDMANYPAALQVYKNILSIYQKLQQQKEEVSKEYLSTLKGLAVLYDRWKLNEQALDYYKQVVELQDKMQHKGLSLYINSLINLSSSYAVNKEFDKAYELIENAIKLNAKLPLSKINIQELDKIEWIYPRLATMALHTYGDNILKEYGSTKANDKDKITKSYALIKQAIEINKKHRSEFWSEKDKLYLLNVNYQYTCTALNIGQLLNNFNKEAYYLIENNKAALLSEGIKTQQANKFLPKDLADKEKDLTWKYSLALRSILEANSKEEQEYIESHLGDIQKNIRELKVELEQKYSKYYQLKYGNYIVDFEKIQEGLQQDELLIQYLVSDKITYILGISKTDSKIFYSPISLQILQDSVAAIKKGLTDFEYIKNKPQQAYNSYTTLSHWLYIGLLKNALEHFADKKKLVIIPDADLGLIPFEVLLSEQAPKDSINYKNLSYLLKEYSISYHYSASLWYEHNAPKKTNNVQYANILAMAGSYNLSENTATERSPQIQAIRGALKPLSAVKIELNAIKNFYKGDFVLEQNSTEQYFKEAAPNYDIIHLAMHATGNKGNSMLSSLYFTENGDKYQDNILEAWEIMQMNLKARLVVLSACESGVGVYLRGDGVSSLARSFMFAGASSLLVSLWKVNDQSTAAIMQNFYFNLSQNMQKSEALRMAKLQYIDTYDEQIVHPAYWAAFIQIGEDIPILPVSNNYTVYISIIALLSIGILIIWRRKQQKQIA